MFVRVRAPHRPMTPHGVTQVVVSVGRRAGLGDITAHRLRHTAASELLRRGAPLREIGQLLRPGGHPNSPSRGHPKLPHLIGCSGA